MEKSLAHRFLEKSEATPEGSSDWIIICDFIKKKPNPQFWRNLKKMKNRSSLRRIQYSVLFTSKRNEVIAAVKLAEHSGAVVELFRVEKINKGHMQY